MLLCAPAAGATALADICSPGDLATASAFVESGECIGFVRGVLATQGVQVRAGVQPQLFCPPFADGDTLEQAREALRRWTEAHPEQSVTGDAALAATYAFATEFPCSR